MKSYMKLMSVVIIGILFFTACIPEELRDENQASLSETEETELTDTPMESDMPIETEQTDKKENSDKTDPDGKEVADSSGDNGYFPLYAMLPEDGIYLYGVEPKGMILYQSGKGTYFDWPGLTPRFVLPEMLYDDLDNNGKKELSVVLCTMTGTGVKVKDLHVLTVKKADTNPTYKKYTLLGKDTNELVKEELTSTLDGEEKKLKIEFQGNHYTTTVNLDSEAGEFTGIEYDDNIDFTFEDTDIHVKIGVGMKFENHAALDHVGNIEADVVFDGKDFKLENQTFDWDNK